MGDVVNGDLLSLKTSRPLKTHCYVGHEYTPENTGLDSRGHRVCKACARKNGYNRLKKFRDKQKRNKS